jgi:hypothetical protein
VYIINNHYIKIFLKKYRTFTAGRFAGGDAKNLGGHANRTRVPTENIEIKTQCT